MKDAKGTTYCADEPGSFTAHVDRVLRKGGVSNVGYIRTRALSLSEVVTDVNANRLPSLRWQWDANPSTGHMLVIRGYDTGSGNVSVMDPLNTTWSENVNFGWMVKGNGHTWTHSRTGVSR